MKSFVYAFAIPILGLCMSAAQTAQAPAQRIQKTSAPAPEKGSQPQQQLERPRNDVQGPEQQPPSSSRPPAPESVPGDKQSVRTLHFDMTEMPPVQTHHEMTVNGRRLRYTATAGRLPIKDAEGKTGAEMFFVAYILDGSDPATRPLTFAYNGGPLTPSIWLHMGCLGPRKVALEPEGGMPQPPYRLADNPNTALGETDLVLVDAIGTGYSRPVDTTSGHRFWNVDGDIESFGQFIMMYLSRYERWSSPLYLFGESYGTTRSAGLSDYLADQGISLNGIVLLSTTLDLESVVFSNTNDIPYPLVLPTYTMIAGYHKRLPADLQQDLKRTRHEVEQWALSEYWQALAKGDALSTADRQNVLEKLAHYTGLPKQVVDWANLRVDAETFTHYLLADQKLRVGTVDGRYAGPDPEGFLKTSSFDPSITRIESAFITTFQIYLRQELGYKVDMPYYISARRLEGFVWDWGTPGFGGGYPETAIALRHAMLKNPFLKVLVMEGYYDLSTPYFAANYTMDHLGLPTQFRQNISYATYESGHMVYVDEKSHADLERDFANFLEVTARKGDRIGK